MKWTEAFTFNRAAHPGQNYRLNVKTISGSSENGFSLRAGPPRAVAPPGQDNFDPNNGTSITADGNLPMNFNRNGTFPITLGNVPQSAAGKTLTISQYDTDVGTNNTVTYTCDALPGLSWTFDGANGLPGNGRFGAQEIPIPANYPGGNWIATYTAGREDTSVWSMSFTGAGPGGPGAIRLVQ